MPHLNSRELVTLVETIQLTGEVIPLMVIISGQNLIEDWFDNLPPSYLLARLEIGYSNDKLALNFIRYFHKIIKGLIRGRNRLLLIDGYGSYNTFKVITYARKHNIHLYTLPPHITHFLQPLDIGCFQPLKYHHG